MDRPPMSIDILPGSGDMQAQMDLVYPSRNYVFQKICRGGSFYWRTVPITNNTVDWNHASEWFGPLGTGGYPGSGEIRTLDAYILPGGKEAQLAVWRGNSISQKGYSRDIGLDYPAEFALREDDTSYVGWIFDSQDYFTPNNVPFHKWCDYYSYDWGFDYGSIQGHNARGMAPGIVLFAGVTADWNYGNHVIVQSLDNPRFAYLYAHLQNYTVAAGDIVGTNTLIGHAGNYNGHPNLLNSLYQKITLSDPSFNNLKLGKNPSGKISSFGTGSMTKYAAPVYNLVPSESYAVIVDDGDPGFRKYIKGEDRFWVPAYEAGFRDDMLMAKVRSNTSLYARWYPTLPSPGNYEVKAFIPENGSTHHATYSIIANGSTHQKTIDQFNFEYRWVTLGAYQFNASGQEFVLLSNCSFYVNDTNTTIAFDAVSFTKQ